MHIPSSSPGRVRRGFTLIELLVVIAIIAILAAILFPVFAQAKAAAKKTAAISNGKQIDLAQIMYSDDYDDVFVPYFSGLIKYPNYNYVYTSPQIYWPQLISSYVQKTIGSGPGGANGTVAQAEAQDLSKVFFDPIEPFKTEAGSGCSVGFISSWGISDDIVNWWCPNGVANNLLPVSQGQVAGPANTLVFTETFDWLCGQNFPGSTLALSYFDLSVYHPGSTALDGAQYTLQSPYQATYTRTFNQDPDPNGMNNTLFADGHVKSIHTSQLTHQGNYWSITGNDLWP